MDRRAKYLTRALQDLETIVKALQTDDGTGAYSVHDAQQLAPAVLLAARLEAIEDALVNGFPIAGEGV